MRIRLYYLLIIIILFCQKINANEIEIISDNIKIFEDGKIIKSKKTLAKVIDKNLYIEGDESLYNKNTKEIILKNNVLYVDKLNEIKIKTTEARYKELKDLLSTKGKTEIFVGDNYKILSNKVFYDRKNQKIFSNDETTIQDIDGNTYNLEEKFLFDINNEIISTSKINIIDTGNNIYKFENAKINLVEKEILGKELKINFEDGYFGNPKNDPVLKGRSAISNEKETKVFKSVFSTCNTENKTCPGWEIETEEFIHDKIEKVFSYKNSWIKIFGKEVFYIPFFSHPDPTVKRKSGFLPPTYGTSNNYGDWINIPYFKAIDIDKDFTFKPRLYLDDKIILQSEYRQAFENSSFIADFSYNNDGKNTNSHFFAKNNGKTKNGDNYDFQYQSVSNDEYLKLHNLSNSSDIITDESLLTSKFYLRNRIDDNTVFTNEFFVYEDLSKRDNDRFQYIFPNFNFNKKIDTINDYKGDFYFKTSGYQKQYDTNYYQAVITNNFLFKSNNIISKNGLKNNYQFLLKQDNSFTSSPLDDKDTSDLYQSVLLKSEYPLLKETNNYRNYLKPIVAIKFSPNNSKDISSKDLRLSYDNIFSFNRISSNRNIEEGRSLSIGLEYSKNDLENNNIFKFAIANSLSDKENNNLPSKSKLDQTRSDIVGKASFNVNDFLDLNYKFSYDRDLKNSNYQSLSTDLDFNFFNVNINYLSEDNEIGNTETMSNSTNFNINDENILKFRTTKNLKTDFTEYFNFIYEYETDCLIASVEFKKQFYKDGNLLPDKSLLFYLRFIPFAELRPEAKSFK